MLAALHGKTDAVRVMAKAGGQIDLVDEHGDPCATAKRHIDIIKCLIDANASTSVRNASGKSAGVRPEWWQRRHCEHLGWGCYAAGDAVARRE